MIGTFLVGAGFGLALGFVAGFTVSDLRWAKRVGGMLACRKRADEWLNTVAEKGHIR